MSTTVVTADNRLRQRLDTVASGSTWGTETIDYLSQAQQQVVADLHDSMFSDGNLTGVHTNVPDNASPVGRVLLVARADDSMRVLFVTHTDGAGVTRGARKQDNPESIYNRASINNYSSPAQGGAFYALSTSRIVVFPVIGGDVITENYLKIPAALTPDASFQVPDWLVSTVITYALYLCLLQVRNTAEADRAMAEYRNQVVSWYKSFKLDPPPKFLSFPTVEK